MEFDFAGDENQSTRTFTIDVFSLKIVLRSSVIWNKLYGLVNRISLVVDILSNQCLFAMIYQYLYHYQ